MKKIMYFGIAVLFGLLSAGCTDQLSNEINQEAQPIEAAGRMTFTATLEDTGTKTAMNGLKVVWSKDDEIRVFNPSTPEGKVYTLIGDGGSSTGSFTGDPLEGSGPYVAFYPASMITDFNVSTLMGTGMVPQIQYYAAGSFGNQANLAYGNASGSLDGIRFKNLCGALEISLTGSAIITALNLYTRGNEMLNGNVSVLVSSDGTVLSFTGDASNETLHSLSLDCGNGVVLSSTPTPFYFIVPEGALADGFTLEVVDSEGKAMLRNAAGGGKNTIIRSEIRPLSTPYSQQYNASFLAADYHAGVVKGVLKEQSLSDEIAFVDGATGTQFAWYDSNSDHTVRIQNWSTGYALSVTAPLSLPLGTNQSISIEALGNTGAFTSQASVDVKVIKKSGNRSWLVDDAGNGYIIQ